MMTLDSCSAMSTLFDWSSISACFCSLRSSSFDMLSTRLSNLLGHQNPAHGEHEPLWAHHDLNCALCNCCRSEIFRPWVAGTFSPSSSVPGLEFSSRSPSSFSGSSTLEMGESPSGYFDDLSPKASADMVMMASIIFTQLGGPYHSKR